VRWNEPEWRRQAEGWVVARLAELGIRSTAPIEQTHVRPWGTTFRVPTGTGPLWFKANMPELAFEVAILRTIEAIRPQAGPRLLAADPDVGWMLMEDAGVEFGGGDVAAWERVLSAYAELQIDASSEASALVAAGVPHRTTPGMLDELERMLEDDRNVRAPSYEIPDEQLARVGALLPRLREACDVVAEFGLPDTLQHDDVHGWNVFLRNGEPVFIDWGDACIAQPALSLAIPLAGFRRSLPDGVDRARDAYYEPWTRVRPRHELDAAHETAMLLAHVTGLLKWGLINSGLRDDERGEYAGAVRRRLRELLEAACA
jgi:Phosphotransferase enzyme family